MNMIWFRFLLALTTALNAVIPPLGLNLNPRALPVGFSVERVSEVFAADGADVREYPTVIQLRHQPNAADNGKLLATFERFGSTYMVFESTDDAQSWRHVSTVTDTLNQAFWPEWMPFLYELPADIGAFSKGTVLLAATSVYGAGVTDSTITLYASTDLGRTFTAFCNVDKAGGTDWGVWEPFLIYEEASGRLFCFYSDDSDPAHSQKLVYKYSTDLVHWSEKTECVACADPDLRPGMVSIAELGDGSYFMVYEMVGIDGNPIYCKRADRLDDWGDPADYGTVISAAGKVFGSSPYAAWSPVGGECGTLIVTADHMVRGKSRTGTDLFLSFDYGKTFAPIDNPLPYDKGEGHGRCGYSPSLFVAEDGAAIYYANNPPQSGAGYRIAVAKIILTEK